MNFLFFAICIFLIIIIFRNAKKPTHNKIWRKEQNLLPHAKINNNLITIYNIRNCVYKSKKDFSANYYNKTFDLNKISSLDFIVQPFGSWVIAAHTFLSFGFEDGSYVSISIEARRKKNVEFSTWKGLLNIFEIIYIVADEKDILKYRALHLKDKLYLYPINIRKSKNQELFKEFINKINKIYEKPEFYNTFTNTCSTNIVRHIQNISSTFKIKVGLRVLFPALSAKMVYKLGKINTFSKYNRIKAEHYINDKINHYKNSENFSKKIREK